MLMFLAYAVCPRDIAVAEAQEDRDQSSSMPWRAKTACASPSEADEARVC
jgi:hypothetical protein